MLRIYWFFFFLTGSLPALCQGCCWAQLNLSSLTHYQTMAFLLTFLLLTFEYMWKGKSVHNVFFASSVISCLFLTYYHQLVTDKSHFYQGHSYFIEKNWLFALGCAVRLVRSEFPDRDETQAIAVKTPSSNHWTIRELPGNSQEIRIFINSVPKYILFPYKIVYEIT